MGTNLIQVISIPLILLLLVFPSQTIYCVPNIDLGQPYSKGHQFAHSAVVIFIIHTYHRRLLIFKVIIWWEPFYNSSYTVGCVNKLGLQHYDRMFDMVDMIDYLEYKVNYILYVEKLRLGSYAMQQLHCICKNFYILHFLQKYFMFLYII